MNIDGSKIKELFNTNTNAMNIKNASVQANSVEFVNSAEAFFDEKRIESANSTMDDYDRLVHDADTVKTGEMAVTPEVIDKMAEAVNADDFSKYEEWGLAPDKDDPTNILTVSERINIMLATYCEDYEPTGNISMEDIKGMYGNSAMAYEVGAAVEKASNLEQIGRNESEYLIANNMDLTIDNVYMAEYSVSKNANNSFQTLSDSQWQELKPQVEKVLGETGLEINDSNLENGKWLIEEKLPVTAENLYKLEQIDMINENISKGTAAEQWTESIMSNVNLGIAPGASSANYYQTVSNDAVITREIIENGSDEEIEALVLDGKSVTLLNMKKAEEVATRKTMDERKNTITKEQEKKIQDNRKALLELKLKMTVEASAVMIKNGLNIDVMPFKELVNEIEKLEAKQANMVFAVVNATGNVAGNSAFSVSSEQTSLYTETRRVMQNLYATPAYVLGSVVKAEIDFTATDMVEKGAKITSELFHASAAYEVLGTKPDGELGDSLAKAFAGIDGILEGNGLIINEQNERAVRILAYNQMEITKENIRTINELDIEVSRLIDNLTPKTTAYLISNGINPLKTDIRELNRRLEEINKEIGASEVEKYSEYLVKLEKNKEIEKEDREAYIGIYRLLRMIEKGDRRAIGAVNKQGLELNMKNLLAANRSLKSKGKDITINDDLGLASEIKLSESNIDRQLDIFESEAYLKRAVDNISPERISEIKDKEDLGEVALNELIEKLATEEKSESDSALYDELRYLEITDSAKISEMALQNIMQDGTAKNMENIIGLSYYVLNGQKTFSGVKDICKDENVDSDVEEIKEMLDGDGDAEEFSDSIKKLNMDIKEALLNNSQISAKDIRDVMRASDYMVNAANNNSYYVPVMLNGEETTIKVTLRNEEKEQGKVSIKMHMGEEEINAELSAKHGEINALIMAGDGDLIGEKLSELKEKLSKEFAEYGYDLNAFNIAYEEYNYENKNVNKEDKVTTNMLFSIAKAFIKGVKNTVEHTDKSYR